MKLLFDANLSYKLVCALPILFLLLLHFLFTLAHAESANKLSAQNIADQLSARGFQVSGNCKVVDGPLDSIPLDLKKANPPWGVQQYACKNGGYALEKYSGKPYSMLSCDVKAWLDSGQGKRCNLRASGFVVEGELGCLYLVADAECGLAPGVMAINARDVIKE